MNRRKNSKGYVPKSGDWDCTHCGLTKIFGKYNNCKKCGNPKPNSIKAIPEQKQISEEQKRINEEQKLRLEKEHIERIKERQLINAEHKEWSELSKDVRSDILNKIRAYLKEKAEKVDIKFNDDNNDKMLCIKFNGKIGNSL